MRRWGRIAAAAAAATIAGCASLPTPVMPADENDPETFMTPPPTPMVESPPLEPVEPPLPIPPVPAPAPSPPQLVAPQPAAAPPVVVVAPPASPELPSEDEQMLALLADLQRYGSLQGEELKRELASATQALSRQRNDVNRVRLAVLYTLLRSSQDDQRAVQLFENVARSAPPNSSIRHLAAVLQAQVTERQRAVHDEQQKADVAVQKLEALREMERSLLRDRVRSGGGGGGAGGSGR